MRHVCRTHFALAAAFAVTGAGFTTALRTPASYADLQAGKPTGLENTTAMWGMLMAKY